MVASPPRENIPLFQANHGGVPADFLMAGNGIGDYCYYRQPNGWITVSPIGKDNSDLHRYQDEDWKPLREYGPFDFPREYYANHPFEVLFLRGGAHEMPIAQIKALGFDRNPPLLPRCNLALGEEHNGPTRRPIHFSRCWMGAQSVVFPQLEGIGVEPVSACEFCEREDFTSKKGLEQHMRVMHLEEIREIATAREMAQGMRDAVIAGVQGGLSAPTTARNLAGIGVAVAGMEARPYGCGLCGEAFAKLRGSDPELSLEAHVKFHDDTSPDDAE